MRGELYWIDGPWTGRLTISARPRGDDWLEDEVADWRAAGVRSVLSLLTSDEIDEFGLAREEFFCRREGLRFHRLPIVDRSMPESDREVETVNAAIEDELRQGMHVNVHRRQGIGRSALIAAALLMESGVAPEAAIERISKARRVPVPETQEQRARIDQFAASIKR